MLLKIILPLSALIVLAWGHGMMLDPVNRASRWRVDSTAEPDYNDNELYCGGAGTQWSPGVDGKCGICGDSWKDARPRPHEIGGKWGQGTIVKSYKAGADITVDIKLSANHLGYFRFDLCNLDGTSEDDACFKNVLSTNQGGDKWYPTAYETGEFDVGLKLPGGLTCNHCVLRWTYTGGNTWGDCGNGTSLNGCGPQETFRNCADIRIT